MISDILLYTLACCILIASFFTLAFAVAIKKYRQAAIDFVWGSGFVVISWLGVFSFSVSWQKLAVAELISLWNLCLIWHFEIRTARFPEGFFDTAIKPRHKGEYPFFDFLFQAFVMAIMCLPFYTFFPATLKEEISIPASLGAGLSLIGLYWKWISVSQLKEFIQTEKKQNPDLAIATGLWAFSRHPNYFGEITFWFGIWIMCLSPREGQDIFAGWDKAALGFLSPLLIALIIFKEITPMLESRIKTSSNYKQLEEIPYIFPKILRRKK